MKHLLFLFLALVVGALICNSLPGQTNQSAADVGNKILFNFQRTKSKIIHTAFNDGYFSLQSAFSDYAEAKLMELSRREKVKDEKKVYKLKGTWHIQFVLLNKDSLSQDGYFATIRMAKHVGDPNRNGCKREKEQWFAYDERLTPFMETEQRAETVAHQAAVFMAKQGQK